MVTHAALERRVMRDADAKAPDGIVEDQNGEKKPNGHHVAVKRDLGAAESVKEAVPNEMGPHGHKRNEHEL